ncbi:MAG: hypothetical protein MUQ60_12030 [Porticoccaceae bacterium]|nr:hypothetical protein [Porticoccaceae bacterium]
MNFMLNRLFPLVSLIAAVLATFLVSFEYWALILVVLGLAHGVVQPVDDSATKALLIVAAVGFPTIANSLDAIPVIGAHLNLIIDHFALSIGGYALSTLALDVWGRVMPAAEAA